MTNYKDFKELIKSNNEYHSSLQKQFGGKSAEELVNLSLIPGLKDPVEDYLFFHCSDEFKEKYKKEKQSKLEANAQSSPK